MIADELHEDWRQAAISVNAEVAKAVIGQEPLVNLITIALLARGHVLLEGAPGLAKTRLARLIADAVEGDFKRIQFTPDLLPSDLVGSAIYVAADQRFEFQRGPVFANFVLADEINRAPAKVQSALLEAMEEGQVTSGETTHQLAWPFFVIATQNPVEHEGTWDLPQAQMDRFLMQINVGYPELDAERAILDLAMNEAQDLTEPVSEVISRDDLKAAQAEVAALHVSELIRDYVVRLISNTRSDALSGVGEHLACPASPRGTIMLTRAAQARAWLMGPRSRSARRCRRIGDAGSAPPDHADLSRRCRWRAARQRHSGADRPDRCCLKPRPKRRSAQRRNCVWAN